MFSCKEVSHLASKSLDAKLTWRERGGMWLHLLLCELCRRYVRDLHLLRKMLMRLREVGMDPLTDRFKLSDKAREQIRKALNDKSRN